MTLHTQVAVEHDGRTVEVDEGIASLILALWQRGFHTFGSCEAQEGTAMPVEGRVMPAAWIAFASITEAEAFNQLIDSGGGRLIPAPDLSACTDEQVAAHHAVYPPGTAAVAFPSTEIQAVLDSFAKSAAQEQTEVIA